MSNQIIDLQLPALHPAQAKVIQEAKRFNVLCCGRRWAWFLSTPKGMNYFKVLFDLGQDSERDDWASWQKPTVANPFIDPAEIGAAQQDLTEAAFNQEYLALFVNWEGSVFRRVGEA